jgi:hypothetical protein
VKVTLYKFYSLEDFINALSIMERELAHQEDLIPGLRTEYVSIVGDDKNAYYIQVTLQHETED